MARLRIILLFSKIIGMVCHNSCSATVYSNTQIGKWKQNHIVYDSDHSLQHTFQNTRTHAYTHTCPRTYSHAYSARRAYMRTSKILQCTAYTRCTSYIVDDGSRVLQKKCVRRTVYIGHFSTYNVRRREHMVVHRSKWYTVRGVQRTLCAV